MYFWKHCKARVQPPDDKWGTSQCNSRECPDCFTQMWPLITCVLSLWAACNIPCTCKPNWLRIDVHYGRQIGFISMFTVGARYMFACVCLLAVPLAFESLFLARFDRVVEVSKIIKCSSSFLHFSQLTAGVLLLSSLIFHPSHANRFIIQRSL